MIVINRKNLSHRDKSRNYEIIIDGEICDKIKNGETKNIDISPGHHTINLKIDWCRSNTIEFDILDNETIEFDCGNSMHTWRILFSLIYVTFLKNKYLWIKRV